MAHLSVLCPLTLFQEGREEACQTSVIVLSGKASHHELTHHTIPLRFSHTRLRKVERQVPHLAKDSSTVNKSGENIQAVSYTVSE